MSFDVTALGTHIDERAEEMKTVLKMGYPSAGLFDTLEGVAGGSTVKMPKLTQSIVESARTCATRADNGTTAVAQYSITAYALEYTTEWCAETMRNTFVNKYWTRNATDKTKDLQQTAFFSQIATNLQDEIMQRQEIGTWQSVKTISVPQGYPAVGAAGFDEYDGILRTIDAASGVVDQQTVAGTTQTAITSANVIDTFTKHAQVMPVLLRQHPDTRTFCGWDVFYLLVQAYQNSNLYNYYPTTQQIEAGEITLPNGLKVKALMGLNSSNAPAVANARMAQRIISTRWNTNIVEAVEAVNEMASPETWYDKKDKKVYFEAPFTRGFAVVYGEEIVSYKNV